MEDLTKQKTQIIGSFVLIYEQYFGETTAQAYRQFYTDKDLKTILISAKELMEETMGPLKSKEIFNNIYKQYSLDIKV